MSMIGRFVARAARYALDVRDGNAERYKLAREVTANFRLSAEQLRQKQFERLTTIVDYAYNNCAWYRKKYDEVGFKPGDIKQFSDLSRLPVITKEDISKHADEIVSSASPPSKYSRSLSGGTTGTPVPFYRDSYSQAYRRGIDLAYQRYYGWRDGEWQGLLWAASGDIVVNPTLTEKIKLDYIDKCYFLDIRTINDESYEKFVVNTIRHRPTLVQAYPSLAFDIAQRMEAGRLSKARVPLICVSGEPLYEFQRAKIEDTWADNVYSRYGAREFGTVAFECPRKDGLHVMIESVYLETVSPENIDGVHGTLLVTDLLNRAMPMIRYRVGDIARLDHTPCPCGLSTPRLRDLEGREADTIWRPDGTGILGIRMLQLMSMTTIKAKLQFAQTKSDELVIRIEGKIADEPQAIEFIKGHLIKETKNLMKVTVEEVEKIAVAPSGKYRYVINETLRP